MFSKSMILSLIFLASIGFADTSKKFPDGVTTTKLNVDNVQADGNTVSTTNTNGDLTFDMNGSGRLILTDLSASTVPYLDSNKKVQSSSVTPTQLGYVDFTSSGQTQLNSKAPINNAVFTGTTSVVSLLVGGNVGIGGTFLVSGPATLSNGLAVTGSITGATWAGNAITPGVGGLGYTSFAAGSQFVGAGTTSISKIGIGSLSQIWTVTGASTVGWANAPSNLTGMSFMWEGSTCPTGSVPLDGTSYLRSGGTDCGGGSCANLFAVVGTTYGAADGTHFNVRDARGVVTRGAGSQTISAISYTGTRGTTQGDQFQGHYHTFTNGISYSAGGFSAGGGAAGNTLVQATTGPTTDGSNGTPRTGSETRMANTVALFCVWY